MSKTFNEGVAASAAGNFDEAIAKFNEALKTNPQCSDCYYNIGVANAGKKDYDKAEEAYKKAIEVKPSAEAYNGLASVYTSQRKFDWRRRPERRRRSWPAAPGGGGGSPEATYNQGVVLWNAGKVAEAKAAFEQVIAAEARSRRGALPAGHGARERRQSEGRAAANSTRTSSSRRTDRTRRRRRRSPRSCRSSDMHRPPRGA